jgi:nucleoside transporter
MVLFVMMVVEIFIWGAWQPKIFEYMTMLKFTDNQQFLVGSIFGIASLIGIFFSNQFADRTFSAERFLAFSHLISGLALLGASQVRDFPTFFTLFLISGLLYVPTISVTNSLAFAHLKDPANEFGPVRMGGTIGWIIASWPFVFLLGGLKDEALIKGTSMIFVVAGVASLVMAAFSLTLPHTPPRKDAAGMDKLAWMKALKLLAHPAVLVLFIVTFIDSTIHNGYFVLSGGFLSAIGISNNMTMVVMSIGQVAEIVTMLVLGAVLKQLGWKWTMVVGILGHALRFAIFAYFPENKPLIIGIQVLHGICYAFFFATLYIYIDEVFPKDIRTSAQGLFNLLVLGVGAVVASYMFPKIKSQLTVNGVVDWENLFLIPTGMAVVAIVLLVIGFWPPKSGTTDGGSLPPAH